MPGQRTNVGGHVDKSSNSSILSAESDGRKEYYNPYFSWGQPAELGRGTGGLGRAKATYWFLALTSKKTVFSGA